MNYRQQNTSKTPNLYTALRLKSMKGMNIIVVNLTQLWPGQATHTTFAEVFQHNIVHAITSIYLYYE